MSQEFSENGSVLFFRQHIVDVVAEMLVFRIDIKVWLCKMDGAKNAGKVK